MEEICVVCAEEMEWVAYGECGHTDVCAICIARLRFVCDDRRCCICKSLSPFVFVTRASGSLTRIINDFSILPAEAKDGKVGSYYFHGGIQAYFDDFDAYKIITDKCRLSCTVCDKSASKKKRGKFKDVEHLKDHLARQHELFFCSLCLGNKKVFIGEQKLYSQVQLIQHIRYGDSEVDGSKSERCGFSGHPFCEFCLMPFYGENELFSHMSTEHFTCHICKRQRADEFEYFKDYNDLEDHFREIHFLCEDDTCLDKKFVVFADEAEIKRHTALEHGGNMSRAKRNAALQLPTCFRTLERQAEGYRVRTRVCGPGVPTIRDSSATSLNAEGTSSNFLHDPSANVHGIAGHSGTSDIRSTANPGLSSSRPQSAPLDFRSVLLSGSEFPTLPRSSKRKRRKSKKKSQETVSSSVDSVPAPSLASGSAQSGRSSNSVPAPSLASSSAQSGRSINSVPTPSLASSSTQSGRSSNTGIVSNTGPAVFPQSWPLAVGHITSSSSLNDSIMLNSTSCGTPSASSATPLSNGTKHAGSSSSALKIGDGQQGQPTTKDEDIQAANKSLIDKILASLDNDKDKFAAFKIVSKEYRDGEIDAREYACYAQQFGLAHLILDLARFCPDPQKRKELIEIHTSGLVSINEDSLIRDTASGKRGNGGNKKKGKGKCVDSESSKGECLSDGLVKHMKELKVNDEPRKEEPSSSNSVDHAANVFSETPAVTEMSVDFPEEPPSTGTSTSLAKTTASGGKKKLKKTSKFLKTRLGESSSSVDANLNLPALPSDLSVVRPDQDSILATVRGVWRNGGGRRLVTLSEALPSSR